MQATGAAPALLAAEVAETLSPAQKAAWMAVAADAGPALAATWDAASGLQIRVDGLDFIPTTADPLVAAQQFLEAYEVPLRALLRGTSADEWPVGEVQPAGDAEHPAHVITLRHRVHGVEVRGDRIDLLFGPHPVLQNTWWIPELLIRWHAVHEAQAGAAMQATKADPGIAALSAQEAVGPDAELADSVLLFAPSADGTTQLVRDVRFLKGSVPSSSAWTWFRVR